MLRQTFPGSNFARHLTWFHTSRIDVYKLSLRKRASDHSPLKSRLSLLSCVEERGIRVFIPFTEANQYLRVLEIALIIWYLLWVFSIKTLYTNNWSIESIVWIPWKKNEKKPCSSRVFEKINSPLCWSTAHSHHLLGSRLNLQSRWIQLHRRTDLL